MNIMKNISDNYISKFSGAIYKNNNESDHQKVNKAGIEFGFVLYHPTKSILRFFTFDLRLKTLKLQV